LRPGAIVPGLGLPQWKLSSQGAIDLALLSFGSSLLSNFAKFDYIMDFFHRACHRAGEADQPSNLESYFARSPHSCSRT